MEAEPEPVNPTPEASGPIGLGWRPATVPAAAATVVLAACVAAAQGSLAGAVLRGAMVLAVVPCALIDLERRIIPNRITGPGAVVALVIGLALDPGGEPGRLLAGALAGGFLLVAALVYPAGMGMGDVKLTGMMGLFLGGAIVVALFVALIASVLTGVAIATRRGARAARKTALPFGPYLAAGGVFAALAGDPILHAYLRLAH
jgi:leader peptidase (prepilin peptidase)/N-methyltransferase